MHVFLLLILFFLPLRSVFAIYDPLTMPNNKYGIHIVDTNDIPDISALTNTNGGDWGYVTLVLSDGERNRDHWQIVFDEMRKRHLIPILRLATHVESAAWAKPNPDRFYEIVELLSGLNWPVENRYVILYNEPNHANEWGGTLAPEDYANTFVTLASMLKKANEDFFILPAGLDVSAASDNASLDAATYLRRMIAAKPEILTLMDGWTSHSYPNPGFSGSPYATGRGTLQTYHWEMDLLKELGLTKTLPIFITETGWVHSEGKVFQSSLLTSEQISKNILTASTLAWSDPRIAAITPFLFSYQDVPFDHFSWKKIGVHEFYPEYYAYQSLAKSKGAPKQRERYTFQSDIFPGTLVSGSTYTLSAVLKNEGQGILDANAGYELSVSDGGSPLSVSVEPFPVIEPGKEETVTVHLKTPKFTGKLSLNLHVKHQGSDVIISHRTIRLVAPPSIALDIQLAWQKSNNVKDVTVLVYDNNTLIQKIAGLTLTNGEVTVRELNNIVPGKMYRVVTLIPGYLPRQIIAELGSSKTSLKLKRFLPLDFNGDGTFTLNDLQSLIAQPPARILRRFFGP